MAVAELPDWVLGVNIELQTLAAVNVDIVAMTVGTIAVDIVAQTVGNIAIDIAAQTMGNVAVDIAAQSVGNINIDIAAQTLGTVAVDIAAQTLGTVAIDIAAQTLGTVAISINVANIIGNIPIDIVAQTLGNVAVDIAAQSVGNINIDIAAQTLGTVAISINVANIIGNIPIDIVAQTLGTVAIDIAAQTLGTVAIDIAAQTLGNVAIDISAQTLGNVAIDIAAQSVGNLNIDVAAQTVDLNIKTSGGVNLMIDVITQAAYLERRSTLSNDNGVVAPNAPPAFYTCETYKGKFFPRGMRGKIEQIQIYCKDAGADLITLRYSPHPCAGPYGEVDITPLAGWSWVSADVEEMWNYDSLFIWVVECAAGTDWGYEVATPYDGHSSANAGRTWADLAIRPFIRVVITGETVGDIPVSGTVNTIEVPTVGGFVESAIPVNCPDGVITDLATFDGAGTLTMARVIGFPAVNPDHFTRYYQLTIFVDGWRAITVDNLDITQDPTAASGRSSMGELMKYQVGAVDWMRMNLRLPIKFRRSLLLRFRQQTGAAMTCTGELYINRQT